MFVALLVLEIFVDEINDALGEEVKEVSTGAQALLFGHGVVGHFLGNDLALFHLQQNHPTQQEPTFNACTISFN